MIYKISNKYYVNISPMIFSEVDIVVENGEIVIKPIGKKIEVNENTEITTINLNDERIKIANSCDKKEKTTTEHRPNKYNRRK